MNAPTLSARALQRAVLARQGLLTRYDGTLEQTLHAVGGLQAQYAPSMYLGLWSRHADLARDDLTRALERRSVVQATLQRVTIHLVERSDYWPFALAVRESRRALWLRGFPDRGSEADLQAAAARVGDAVAEGPISRRELEELVGRPLVTGVGLWRDLLRVPPSGTWERRRADLFADAERELGPPERTDVIEARLHLLRRYLAGFGPASAGDIASYTGLAVGEVRTLLADLDLQHFRTDGGTALVDLPDGLLPDEDTPAPVRFLPTWDATLLVHCRRTVILREQDRSRVFSTKTPHSTPTFTVDGTVAGTWRYEKGTVSLAPFEPLAPRARDEAEDEAARLAEFHR